MKHTPEQVHIIDTAKNPSVSLVKVSAVSGAGKTSTLVGIAEALKPFSGLYIAFNKAIATEAKSKFPKSVDCRTIHSLAYKYVITDSDRELDFFTYKCFTEDISYEKRALVIAAMESFFNSAETSMSYFDSYEPDVRDLAVSYIGKMVSGEIPSTFGFTLKYFHLLLSQGELEIEDYDLIMLDEAGDTTGVILEIFKLLDCPKKIMVGDPQQNIYTFMDTINGFEELADEGVLCELSQSFRMSKEIASRIEYFCRAHLSKSMVLKGIDYPSDYQPTTLAYISRANATLIARMIKLNEDNSPYSLTRKPAEIFSLPLALINLSPEKEVYDKRYKYLKDELIKFNGDPALRMEYSSFRAYLRDTFSHDIQLTAALNLLTTYSYGLIFETYKKAKEMDNTSPITLTTAHSSKGLEYDSVYIEDDLNCLPEDLSSEGAIAEYRLYYVACTRAKVVLSNAKMLVPDRAVSSNSYDDLDNYDPHALQEID
jgi:superfamily I DNA/RNA helicase